MFIDALTLSTLGLIDNIDQNGIDVFAVSTLGYLLEEDTLKFCLTWDNSRGLPGDEIIWSDNPYTWDKACVIAIPPDGPIDGSGGGDYDQYIAALRSLQQKLTRDEKKIKFIEVSVIVNHKEYKQKKKVTPDTIKIAISRIDKIIKESNIKIELEYAQ